MFAIAIWDERRQQLLLARDRLGIKPLYLRRTLTEIIFASEIKAILPFQHVAELDQHTALRYFFRYGYVAAPATLLASVKEKVAPARCFWWRTPLASQAGATGSVSCEEDQGDEHKFSEQVYDALRRAVSRQLISDVPLGAFLSGGLDSSSIVSLISSVSGGQVGAYSIGFSGRDSFHSELSDAAAVAKTFATKRREIVVQPDAAALIERLVYTFDKHWPTRHSLSLTLCPNSLQKR